MSLLDEIYRFQRVETTEAHAVLMDTVLPVGARIWSAVTNSLHCGDGFRLGGVPLTDANIAEAITFFTDETVRPIGEAVAGPFIDAMRWKNPTTGLFDYQALINTHDNCELGSMVVYPNRREFATYNNAFVVPDTIRQTRSFTPWFQRGLDIVLDLPSSNTESNLYELDIVEDLPFGSEARNIVLYGNGTRMQIYKNGVQQHTRGGYAFAIGANITDAGQKTQKQTEIRDFAFVGGTKGAVLCRGIDPLYGPNGTGGRIDLANPETMFTHFRNCVFEGGVDDFASDGTVFEDCNSKGRNARPGYRFDKTYGAFCSIIRGGMITNRGGCVEVIDGDQILVDNVQMEWAGSNGSTADPIDPGGPPTQYLGAMVILLGLKRPVNGFTARNCNFGGGPGVGALVAVLNAYRPRLHSCQWRPAQCNGTFNGQPVTANSTVSTTTWSLSPCDLYLANPDADSARGDKIEFEDTLITLNVPVGSSSPRIQTVGGNTVFLPSAFNRTLKIGAYGVSIQSPTFHGNRPLQGAGVWTDATRRMTISVQSAAHPNPHYGLWMPLTNHPAFALQGGRSLSTRGLQAMISEETSTVSFRGGFTGGTVTAGADLALLPHHLQMADGEGKTLAVSGNNPVALRVSGRVFLTLGALDASGEVDMSTTTWPVKINHNHSELIW